jgi:hypothetical protein
MCGHADGAVGPYAAQTERQGLAGLHLSSAGQQLASLLAAGQQQAHRAQSRRPLTGVTANHDERGPKKSRRKQLTLAFELFKGLRPGLPWLRRRRAQPT